MASRRPAGNVIFLSLFAVLILLSVASLSVDVGAALTTKSEAMTLAQEAAVRGLTEAWEPDYFYRVSPTLTLTPTTWYKTLHDATTGYYWQLNGRYSVPNLGLLNSVGWNSNGTPYYPSVQANYAPYLTSGDVVFGGWTYNGTSWVFTPVQVALPANDSQIPNALKVVIRRRNAAGTGGSSSGNNPVPFMFGKVTNAAGSGMDIECEVITALQPAAIIGVASIVPYYSYSMGMMTGGPPPCVTGTMPLSFRDYGEDVGYAYRTYLYDVTAGSLIRFQTWLQTRDTLYNHTMRVRITPGSTASSLYSGNNANYGGNSTNAFRCSDNLSFAPSSFSQDLVTGTWTTNEEIVPPDFISLTDDQEEDLTYALISLRINHLMQYQGPSGSTPQPQPPYTWQYPGLPLSIGLGGMPEVGLCDRLYIPGHPQSGLASPEIKHQAGTVHMTLLGEHLRDLCANRVVNVPVILGSDIDTRADNPSPYLGQDPRNTKYRVEGFVRIYLIRAAHLDTTGDGISDVIDVDFLPALSSPGRNSGTFMTWIRRPWNRVLRNWDPNLATRTIEPRFLNQSGATNFFCTGSGPARTMYKFGSPAAVSAVSFSK